MNCSEMIACLSQSGHNRLAYPPEVQEHQRECAGCRALAALLEEDASQDTLDVNQLRKLQTSVLKELKPVRPLRAAPYFLLAFAAVFIAMAAIGVYRLGPYGWNLLTTIQRTAIVTSLAASAALLSFSLVGQMVPGSRHHLPPALLPLGVIVILFLVLAGSFQIAREPDFLRSGIACLTAGIPYGIPSAIIFWLLLRRGAVLAPQVTGAVAGSLAGLIGMTVLEVHCSNFNLVHIIVWHLGVVAIGAASGLLLGAAGRFVKRKSRP